MNYLIQNATLVNEGEVFKADVLVSDGRIRQISRECRICTEGAEVIDASGKYLIPGIIDEHVHFRDPGLTSKADIYSESLAAVCGGVTSFMDMPNTVPQTVTGDLLEEKFRMAAEKSLANYSFYIGATNDNLSEVLGVDYSQVCGIKLFMGSSTGNMLMDEDKALEELFRQAPCLIAAHCEDEQTIRQQTLHYKSLVESGIMRSDASLHPLIRSAEACYLSTRRAVELAEKTGARLHVMHISTERELSLFRNDIPLKDKKITAETCPHYLTLCDEDYKTLGFAIKCNPAIKTAADRAALRSALESGLIDTIGTDHAPHLIEEKLTGDVFTSKSGFPSIQHSFELMSELARSGELSLARLVTLMCHNPATLYGIEKRGFLREGYYADLAIVDMDAPHTISNESELCKCGWTPFNGFAAGSRVTHTFVNGVLVYKNGVIDTGARGMRLRFSR